jgi:hypothetical protein
VLAFHSQQSSGPSTSTLDQNLSISLGYAVGITSAIEQSYPTKDSTMSLNQRKKFKGMAGASELFPGLVHVEGSIGITAAGAVVAPQPRGATVAHTGTGVYTITLDATGGVPGIVNVESWVQHDSATVIPYAQVRTAVASTGVITLTTGTTIGTAADLPSGATLRFRVVVRDVSITG